MVGTWDMALLPCRGSEHTAWAQSPSPALAAGPGKWVPQPVCDKGVQGPLGCGKD